ARDAAHLAATDCPREPVREKIRATDVANLADAHEIVEGAERFVERRIAIVEVHLIEVDKIGLQPTERRVDRIHDVAATVAGVPGLRARRAEPLGGEHELVALALPPAAEDLFGTTAGREVAAERVDVGSVDERDAEVARMIEDGARPRFVDLQTKGHRAE